MMMIPLLLSSPKYVTRTRMAESSLLRNTFNFLLEI